MRGHAERLLLALNLAVAASISFIFVWGLRGVHRFPTEAAIFATVLLAVLLANAAYFWRHRRAPRG